MKEKNKVDILKILLYCIIEGHRYKSICKKMKDLKYIVIVDSHVGHYLLALSSIKNYKQFNGLNEIGIVIDKKHVGMAAMWKDDISDVIVINKQNDLFRFNHYLYARKAFGFSVDIIPYFFDNGELGEKIWKTKKIMRYLSEESGIMAQDYIERNYSFADQNLHIPNQMPLGNKLSLPIVSTTSLMEQLFIDSGIVKGKSIIIIPDAQCAPNLSRSLLCKIAKILQSKGLTVLINTNEKISETIGSICLPLEYMPAAARYAGGVIATQSGMADFILFGGLRRMLILLITGTDYDKSSNFLQGHAHSMAKELEFDFDLIYYEIDNMKLKYLKPIDFVQKLCGRFMEENEK